MEYGKWGWLWGWGTWVCAWECLCRCGTSSSSLWLFQSRHADDQHASHNVMVIMKYIGSTVHLHLRNNSNLWCVKLCMTWPGKRFMVSQYRKIQNEANCVFIPQSEQDFVQSNELIHAIGNEQLIRSKPVYSNRGRKPNLNQAIISYSTYIYIHSELIL